VSLCLQFLAQIGYCPQFDAINEALTGREMLKLFASLRGVSKINIDYEVNKWVTLMGKLKVFVFLTLQNYIYKLCM
jgi:ABC-type multidrug transport system ATPase subunit